jgi:regulator of sigma E protease
LDQQPPTPDRPDEVKPAAAEAQAADAAEAPPLTPVEWLKANGPYLVGLAALAAWIVVKFDWVGLWWAFQVALGVGFIIFVHELGHFVAAKWCDVHVTTFSIGFGPALPGCSFRRGETLYKVALLPLGGYVNMVGEGPEADEDENYPRSFKNKPVWQRMVIISAGVVMNVLLGCVCFILVYRFPGAPRLPAAVERIEPASPAWRAGVRSGDVIARFDNKAQPSFEDVKAEVATSAAGEEINFTFEHRPEVGGDRNLHVTLAPRKDKGDPAPVIGFRPPPRLELARIRAGSRPVPPVQMGSAADAARALPLEAGDVVLKATDPDRPGAETDLPEADRWGDLARRMRQLTGRPLVLSVRRHGAAPGAPAERVDVPAGGFESEDLIVGTTDPDGPGPYDPFRVAALPPTPGEGSDAPPDYFTYHRRMKKLAAEPVVLQVRRKGAADPVNLFVPPEYHRTLGARMKMGEVAAVRAGSPAAEAGVQEGDILTGVKLIGGGREVSFTDAEAQATPRDRPLDPDRLPFDLAQEAAHMSAPAREGAPKPQAPRVELTVLRRTAETLAKPTTLPAVAWDAGWDGAEETPLSTRAPLSVPQLGLAYRVQSTVTAVADGSPAARAGLEKNDVVEQIRFRFRTEKGSEWADPWVNMQSESPRSPKGVYEQWAWAFTEFQKPACDAVELRTSRSGEQALEVVSEADPTWPASERGLLLLPDVRRLKADNLLTALGYGVEKTGSFIRHIYRSLRGVGSGRISAKENVGGPVEIVSGAFAAAQDPFELLLYLGIISVNLAVVNFLPIPVLDGGHMVFLIYEALRGRPPSEAVRAAATYVGLAMIASLMVFVLYIDINRRWLHF